MHTHRPQWPFPRASPTAKGLGLTVQVESSRRGIDCGAGFTGQRNEGRACHALPHLRAVVRCNGIACHVEPFGVVEQG
jgi:hypothetical protein